MLRSTKLAKNLALFLDVPVSDPEDARRRRLLNIILAGIFISLVAVLLTLFVLVGLGWLTFAEQDFIFIVGAAVAMIIGSAVIYAINRRVSGTLASALLIALLMLVLPFADSYHELVNGRSLFLFVIPIIVSAALLGSGASFVVYFLCVGEMAVLARLAGEPPNFFAIATIFLLALVSWLSARSLDHALRELRQVNIELDRRVDERTRDLSAALARELVEAGKSQAILEGIGDGVMVLDTLGKSIGANPALSRLLDASPGTLLEVPVDQILQSGKLASSDREAILTMLREPYKEMPSFRFRWGVRTLLVNAAPVTTGLGDAIGTVAVFRDFTREAEIEQMKNTFVAMVSHELRTPLNAILGYAEMLREAVFGALNPRQTGVIERIETSSKRLLNMVSDLLDQAQLEAGRMRLRMEEFKTSDLVDALHSMLGKEFKDKGLALNVDLDPQMPAILCSDSHRLQQVLLNLTGNAVKFTDAGRVDVRIYRVDALAWGMEVSDTGPGIAPEIQPYIFESFRQADSTTTRQHGGIGLGLTIVRNLVEVFGGTISLKSEVGRGSTFTVILPFQPARKEEE